MKFFKTVEVEEAVERMLQASKEVVPSIELVSLATAAGRILAEDLPTPYDVPAFRRSTVDGYAVRAKDTVGASESMPSMLTMIGEVKMGEYTPLTIGAGECAYVPTGGMVPEGADSMLMIEYAKEMGTLRLCYKSTAHNDHIVLEGEDTKKGETLLRRGMLITPGVIGMCAALSYFTVPVVKKPTFSILSTGDEIAGESEPLSPGKIRDINTYTIEAIVTQMGGTVLSKRLIRDSKQELIDAVAEETSRADFVLLSGGSSVGTRDFTSDAITALSGGELLFHGLNIKPGKPTLAGFASGTWVIGLPGHPVSAMLVLKEILTPYWRKKYGETPQAERVQARLLENMPSSPGKKTIQTVTLDYADGEWFAKPFYTSSAFISQFVRADGILVLPKEKEGLYQGEIVEVERI